MTETATLTREYLPRATAQSLPGVDWPTGPPTGPSLAFVAVDSNVYGDVNIAVIVRRPGADLIEKTWRAAPGTRLMEQVGQELVELLTGAILVVASPAATTWRLGIIAATAGVHGGTWQQEVFDIGLAAAAVIQRRPPFHDVHDVLGELLTDRLGPVPTPWTIAERARLIEVAYDEIYSPDRQH